MINFTNIIKKTALLVPLTLPIIAFGQSVGDYRTNGDVTFTAATNWQRYNGTNWIAASIAPTAAAGVITVRNHIATVTTNTTLDQVVVEGTLQVNNGATLTLADGIGDDLFVRNRLFFQASGVITGTGQLVLGNQALVRTANENGLAGSITSTNPILTAGASYEFTGTVAQSTGFAGFASLGNPLHFHFKNTAGITIDRNLTITGTLTANKNVPITMGAGVTSFTANAIYNGGSLNNCVGATITPAFTNSAWASPKGIYESPDSSEPTTEASNIWTNSHQTTAHIYWLQNGSGNNRIVVLKADSPISPTAVVDNVAYTANPAFGTVGTELDGGFVIYSGAGSQVNVTGLTNGTTYHVAVFEYNQDCAGNRNYKTGSPLITSFVAEERPFITEWITTDGTLTIPTIGGGYDYTVSYRQLPSGTPTILTGQTGNCTLTGLNNGVKYEVSITGSFPRIHLGGSTTTNIAKIRNIKQWGSIQWTSMQQAFGNLSTLCPITSNAIDVPNLSNVTSMQEMFARCYLLEGGNIANWNTSSITNMEAMFYFTTMFNEAIGNWNTSSVTNMSTMFGGSYFNHQSINNWNTNAVINMSYMFANAKAFNQPISAWNTIAVTNMNSMFYANEFFNQAIGNWNTFNVTNMGSIFMNAFAFNQEIGNWNTGAVTDMSTMFANDSFFAETAFNKNINMWNTSAVTDMGSMFYGAKNFNQPIGSWNTEAVMNMFGMFYEATAFNQSLAAWNITNITDEGYLGMRNMLDNCGMNTANYDATLIGWAAQNVKTGIELGAIGRGYCDALSARYSLIIIKSWTITGDALDCINTSVASLSAFSSCSGVASATQSYTITSTNLSANIAINAPPHFEVSITSPTDGFASSQILVQLGGNLATTTVYIRQRSTAPNGASGTIIHVSMGMLTKNISIPISSVVTNCTTITSFTPTSGGVDTRITINGTGFSPNNVVSINGTPVRRLWYYSPTKIMVQVGDNTTTGKITIGANITATDFTVIPCTAPIDVSATPTNSGGQSAITVSWTNPTSINRVDLLYRRTGATLPDTEFSRVITGQNMAGSQSFTIIGLDASTNYDVFIQTRCDGSIGSNWVAAGTISSGTGATCSRPMMLSPANNSTLAALQLPLTWSAVPNATTYQVATVEVDEAMPPIPVPGTSQLAIFTTNSGVVHFPKPNTKYRVLVRANCDAGGFGEYNDYFYVTTGAVTACLPPNTFPAVTYAVGAGNLADVTLSWSGASGASGSPQYEVHLMLSDGITIHARNTDITFIVWTGMSGGQTYQYRVRTFCTNGNASVFSAWQPFTVPSTYGNCGSAITSLNVSNLTAWGTKLDWLPDNNGTNNPEANGRSYWVQYWNINSPNTIYTISQDSSKIQLLIGVHQGLLAGQQYGCRVLFLCNNNVQTYSATQTFQLLTPIADKASSTINLRGLEGVMPNNNLSIYPNPAKQTTLISYQAVGNSNLPIGLTVIDVLGREVYRETLQTPNFRANFNVSKLAAGVYLIKVQDGGQNFTKKLVVE